MSNRASRQSRFSGPLAVAIALVVGLFVLPPAALSREVNPDEAFEGFDAWVEDVMKEWKVPGLGVAIIHDNQLWVAKGYGYRDLKNEVPADGDTLFAIGSNSKSFTGTVLAMLEDEGKLDWNEPVREYLPAFKLFDPVATDQMTAVDLLSHRSGLPRHDLAWYGSQLSRAELFERMRFLQPTEPFRSKFQYQNLMFMTAGILAEELGGKTWEELVDEKIFGPLHMERSNFSVDAMQKDDNFSYPHTHQEESEIRQIPFRNIDAIGPAGSINSSAREMANYVLFHLNHGKLPGADQPRLLSEENARLMQSPQMVVTGPLAARFSGDPENGDPTYGLGLFVTTYRGHKHVFHGGGIDGFISSMEWLPNDGIGVVVLSNTNGSGTVPNLVARNVMDRLLGLEPVDWAGRARSRMAEAEKAAETQKAQRLDARHPDTQPSHDLEDFTGDYEHPAYGPVQVRLDGGRLNIKMAAFDVPLEHYHYDVFEVPEGLDGDGAGLAGTQIQFYYSKDGTIDRLDAPLEPTTDPIEFKRVAGSELSDPAFLERLTGSYSLGGMPAKVELEGTQLLLEVPGQPRYTLAPDSGVSFTIKGLEGFRIEFEIDRSDPGSKATALISHQPNGTFKAERQ